MKRVKFIPGDITINTNNLIYYLITSIYLTSYGSIRYRGIKLGRKIEVNPWNSGSLTEEISESEAWAIYKRQHRLLDNFYDDYLCHDHRCKPGDLIGCSDCWFRKEKSNIFLPGDLVWCRDKKKKYRIGSCSLALNEMDMNDNITKISFKENHMKANIFETGTLINSNRLYDIDYLIEWYNSNNASLIYGLQGRDKNKSWDNYEYSECYSGDSNYKRYSKNTYYLNPEHRKAICKDLCIYGEGSEECIDCKTNIEFSTHEITS